MLLFVLRDDKLNIVTLNGQIGRITPSCWIFYYAFWRQVIGRLIESEIHPYKNGFIVRAHPIFSPREQQQFRARCRLDEIQTV